MPAVIIFICTTTGRSLANTCWFQVFGIINDLFWVRALIKFANSIYIGRSKKCAKYFWSTENMSISWFYFFICSDFFSGWPSITVVLEKCNKDKNIQILLLVCDAYNGLFIICSDIGACDFCILWEKLRYNFLLTVLLPVPSRICVGILWIFLGEPIKYLKFLDHLVNYFCNF